MGCFISMQRSPTLYPATTRHAQATGSGCDEQRPLQIVLAYNPEAGNFSLRRLARLRARLEQAGHAVTMADSLAFRVPPVAGEVDLVCIVGGDGTVRTVIGQNRDAADNAAYCVYPSGTVNLLAREAGYPDGARAFVRRISRSGATGEHFLGELNGQAFLCCASVGPDSAVVARVSPALKQRFGRFAYVIALLRQMKDWPRPRMRVTVDGAGHDAEAVFICKGRYYAGPWVIDDAADLRSGHFRVVLLDRARRRDFLRLALSAIISRRLADPRWQRFSAQEVEISTACALPIQADGDILATTPGVIRIVPEPVSFF
jgi:diacylglycerol kinase family enzyme